MKLSEENKKDIIKLYLDNNLVREIAKKYNVNRRTIHTIIKDNNIKKKNNHIKLKEYDYIVNMFMSGETAANIAKRYNVNIKTIYNVLKRKNIEFRYGTRKYFFNEEYFCIPSVENCYWAGFIAADGNVFNNVISIGIKSVDTEHLKKFLFSIGGTQNIKKLKKDIVRIDVCSKKIIDDLEKTFYIVPNKTKILDMPDLNECFSKNYIRGFFDGDGTIYMNLKRMQTSFSIVSGSYNILHKISKHILQYTGIKCNIYGEEKFTLMKSGSKALDIMKWLYEEADVFLDRKYNKYNNLFLIRNEYDKMLLGGVRGVEAKMKALYNRGFDKEFVGQIFNETI